MPKKKGPKRQRPRGPKDQHRRLFRENLRTLRQDAGFNPNQLARELGMSVQRYQRIERGDELLGRSVCDALNTALGTTDEDLLPTE